MDSWRRICALDFVPTGQSQALKVTGARLMRSQVMRGVGCRFVERLNPAEQQELTAQSMLPAQDD